jgi:hypothetical protein
MSGTGEMMRRRREMREEAQERFLKMRAAGLSIPKALEAVHRSDTTYDNWRKDPKFRAESDMVALDRRIAKGGTDFADDFAGFRKLWFKHDSPWFHIHAIEALENAEPGSVTLVLFPPEHGKGHGYSTVLPSPGGGWTKVGDMEVGDTMFGRDGNPCTITAIYDRGVLPMRRVHFTDGTWLDCDLDHLWLVRDRRKQVQRDGQPRHLPEHVVSTRDIEGNERSNDGRPAYSVPVCEPLQLPDVELPIHPWVLGYWLGNGASTAGTISTHGEDREYVRTRLMEAGYETTIRKANGSAGSLGPRGLQTQLRAMCLLGNKHIPEMYLWASVRQRRQLLAGLVDSDGYTGNARGQIEYSSTRAVLADDVEQLVRSLGEKPGRSLGEASYKVDGVKKVTGDHHRVIWTARTCPAMSPRKTAMFRPTDGQGDRLRWRYIDRVEELAPEEVRCFTVDSPDSLYVAGEHFIVTHNTTLMEDYICWKLATDPTHRIIVGSEKHSHAKKVVGRVKNRMEPAGPFPSYVARFGPFAPQLGDDGYQPWGADFMNVRRKGNTDERDYSLAALGFGAGIIGTRTDELFVDDPQSTKTVSLTENMVETFRQDWLSRPGAYGKTAIWGSRVGEDDFYNAIIEADIIDNLIMFPAVNSKGEWLWPERYTEAQYARLRKNVGEPGWQRNYMMRPQAAGESKFTQDMLDAHANPLQAVYSDPPPDTMELAVGVDPGFGINATMVAAFCPGRMVILNGRTDHNLRNNQEIVAIVGEAIESHYTPERRVSQVIMEDKAFQKGLLNDESLIRLRERWGFQITGHNTGSTKNDEDFGVASMAAGFLRGEIILPGSDDPQTRAFREALDAELKAWRPRRRGTQLKQDMVMSLWFLWLLWRRRREFVTLGPSNWDTGAVPFNTKVPKLIVPVGAGGWGR